jgi:hypothetical protein
MAHPAIQLPIMAVKVNTFNMKKGRREFSAPIIFSITFLPLVKSLSRFFLRSELDMRPADVWELDTRYVLSWSHQLLDIGILPLYDCS